MRFRRSKKSEAMIPTASMADIAFLLIIFFMVTTVHEADRTRVNLPTSIQYEEAEKGAAIVVVHQDKKSARLIYKISDGKEMSQEVPDPESIYLEASRITFTDRSKQFVLKADGDVRFASIDEMMDTLRRAGVQNLLLLTRPATEEL